MSAEALFAVTATAKPLANPGTSRGFRRSLTVNNTSASDVFLGVGGAAVSPTLHAFKVPAGTVASIAAAYAGDPLPTEDWHIVAVAPVNVVLSEVFGS